MGKQKRLTLSTLLLAAVALAWYGPAAPASAAPDMRQVAQAAGSRVTVDNFAFGPASITVAPGTTVTWTNEDDMVHTVTSTTKVFSSPSLNTGESFSYTFTAPGTYPYFCALHPRMTGTVIVK